MRLWGLALIACGACGGGGGNNAVAPELLSFTSSPAMAVIGEPTSVTWSFAYANTPSPQPICSIDGVGDVDDGAQSTITITTDTTFTLRCTSSAGEATADTTIVAVPAPVAPVLATLVASPSSVVTGTPTDVTFTWTYANTPTPAPDCTLDHGIGSISNGATTSLTLAAATTYTLTCTNAAGSDTKQVPIAVSPVPVAPQLGSFIATPSSVTSGTATNVTWTWAYANSPTPAPSCSIDHGIGTITSGTATSLTLTATTTYTLTCTNSAGTAMRQTSVTVVPMPVAPVLATFAANPATVTVNNPTTVAWSWTYANSPTPAPSCTIDQGVGTVTSGQSTVISIAADTTYTLTCTNSAGSSMKQLTIATTAPVAPVLATLTANPNNIASGNPTWITWTWTYANSPSPLPTCTMNQGIGTLTNGQATRVTQTVATTYTLTCMNVAGSTAAQTTVTIAIGPIITGFSATPSLIPYNTPTTVTWTWSYANSPTPAPACSIEFGIGSVTSGATSSLTLTQARTYRLTCSNNGGTATADATVSINDCAAGLADCDAHATCVDTTESFNCMCNAGYTGDGATCSALESCNTMPTLCDPAAVCTLTGSGYACVCPPGYVGDGLTCSRLRRAFVTSTSGTGNLATWADAGGMTGLAAADAICQARAAAAGLPGTFVAWLSDPTNDAYCRVNGFAGTKNFNCGQSSLPVAAGPWARIDGQPFAGRIDLLLAPNFALYYPANIDELGATAAATTLVFSATDSSGMYKASDCTDWTSAANTTTAVVGLANGGAAWFTDDLAPVTCDLPQHLRCLEVGSSPPLTKRPPQARRVFATSVTGNGNFASWPDSGGLSGLAGADAVCRARARYAGYANAANFKAWLSSSATSAPSRITSNGPWYRLDGIPVAFSKSDLIDGAVNAGISITETHTHASSTFQSAWTGTGPTGTMSSYLCSNWTIGTNAIFGGTGKYDSNDLHWTQSGLTSCNTNEVLYCFED